MSQIPVTIPKNPNLKPAEDYYFLRRTGIGFIQQMGSRLWTDYNTHDPGITILEVLCYAITDLAYRIGWKIQDVMTPSTPSTDPIRPFPNQSFFTAREILSVNPWTTEDFRRLLIDLDRGAFELDGELVDFDGIRNAWVFCKECACDTHYYAWCEEDQLTLTLSYRKPANPLLSPKKVEPRGMYEILLELEANPELGDLNDRKIEYSYSVFDQEGKPNPITIELRFPKWDLEKWDEWKLFLNSKNAFEGKNGESFDLKLIKFNRNKTDNSPLTDAELAINWRNVFYASFEIELSPGGKKIGIENASLRIFGGTFAKNQTTVAGLETLLKDKSPTGFIQRYRNKLIRIESAVKAARKSLHRHRNLDEDYCRVRGVDIEDVAVCADVEVAPDADIERVQAQIWFEIEQYFNPPVRFYTLQEMMDAGIPVEKIFNGPALSNGFIKAEELEAAGLKTVLRVSDIINRLMKIEGVIAVNNLLLTKYDAEGNVIKGAADPVFYNGNPIFNPAKSSASWLLFVSDLHQPRLYHNLSRFLFYKNGLPFLPRMDESLDSLTQLRGEAERPKIKNAPNDLPIPKGTFRNPEDYFPAQYSFPLTYGVGPEGLPSHAGALRRAQARQLKAYLMIFEQLLGNAFAQLAHTAELFSLDPAVDRTYFIREFSESVIRGYNDITNGLNTAKLEEMTETLPEFHDRRNRFLNHLMSRFGEQFSEYALLLTNFQGQKVALDRLIEDKISFLKAYPFISHDRGKAFNYRTNPGSPENIPGLKKRVSLLLGFPDLEFVWTVTGPSSGPNTITHYQLEDKNKTVWLEGNLNVVGSDVKSAVQKAFREIIIQMVQPDAYEIAPERGEFRLKLKDSNGNPLGQHPNLLKTRAEAQALMDELLSWSANERAIVVEHLLLRPKFPGDALYPACVEGPCATCGDEDPYSFRLTFVMPGWTAPYNINLELRHFADRTIREETPSHLLNKICWVGNDGFIENPCDPILNDLAELLITKGLTSGGIRPAEKEACDCANAINSAFSQAFEIWYDDKTLSYIHPDALREMLKNEFTSKISRAGISCTTVLSDALWAEILDTMIEHFHQIALFGWQFERFEDAWLRWLNANAVFDWTEERLQERIEAILTSGFVNGPLENDALCKCAADILTKYGMTFYNWMDSNFKAGRDFDAFTVFTPDPITLCPGITFKPGVAAKIEALLKDRYDSYKEVSYRLWVVVNLLGKLRNTYPGATLHDCDSGSDVNPVRLGLTALGNYPLRETAPSPGFVPPSPILRETSSPPEVVLPASILRETVPPPEFVPPAPVLPETAPSSGVVPPAPILRETSSPPGVVPPAPVLPETAPSPEVVPPAPVLPKTAPSPGVVPPAPIFDKVAEQPRSPNIEASTKAIPVDPVKANKPGKSGKHVKPVKDHKPGKPGKPEKPVKANKPGKPVKPVKANKPGKHGKPAKPAKPKKRT